MHMWDSLVWGKNMTNLEFSSKDFDIYPKIEGKLLKDFKLERYII